MARKPNYDFERRERERIKASKAAERAKLKAAKASPSDGLGGVEDRPGVEDQSH